METSRRVAKPLLWWRLARVRRSSLNEGEARGYRLRFVSASQCSLMSLFGKQLCGCPEKNLRRHPGTSFARGWAGCSPAKYSRLLNAGVVACTLVSFSRLPKTSLRSLGFNRISGGLFRIPRIPSIFLVESGNRGVSMPKVSSFFVLLFFLVFSGIVPANGSQALDAQDAARTSIGFCINNGMI